MVSNNENSVHLRFLCYKIIHIHTHVHKLFILSLVFGFCVCVCVQTIHRGVVFALFALLLHLDSSVCAIIFPIFLLGHDFLRLPWRFVKTYTLLFSCDSLLSSFRSIISPYAICICVHIIIFLFVALSLSLSLLLTALFSSVFTLTSSTDTAKQRKKI